MINFRNRRIVLEPATRNEPGRPDHAVYSKSQLGER